MSGVTYSNYALMLVGWVESSDTDGVSVGEQLAGYLSFARSRKQQPRPWPGLLFVANQRG